MSKHGPPTFEGWNCKCAVNIRVNRENNPVFLYRTTSCENHRLQERGARGHPVMASTTQASFHCRFRRQAWLLNTGVQAIEARKYLGLSVEIKAARINGALACQLLSLECARHRT